MGFRKLRWQGERWRDNMEGSLRPPEKNLYDIFIVFRNIQLYSNDKSKWLLLFLVKNWVSVIFGVMPFVSLQELGLRSPAGECLLSDQTPPQYLASGVITQPGLQEILSQTKLRARRHSRCSVYNWFCWNGKGDIKSHPKKQVKLLHPSIIVILSVRLHAANCCLGDTPQYKLSEIRTPWAQCQYFPKRVKLKRHKSADGGYESPSPSILI